METTNSLVRLEKKDDVLQNTPPESSFSMKGFEHAQRVAKMLCSSSLIPKEYQGNIQNTMIALEMANRIGASPLMVMQNLYIVHGKPSWSSSFIIAALNSCARFSPLRFDLKGDGEEYGCHAWAYDLKTNDKLEGPKVTMKMAKSEGWIDKAGSKWKTMPELMLRYRAAAFFGRLYAPEILMGMHTAEEVADFYQVQSKSSDPEQEQLVEDLKLVSPELLELQELYQLKVKALTEDENNNALRIIDNKEDKSFSKLKKLLQSK